MVTGFEVVDRDTDRGDAFGLSSANLVWRLEADFSQCVTID